MCLEGEWRGRNDAEERRSGDESQYIRLDGERTKIRKIKEIQELKKKIAVEGEERHLTASNRTKTKRLSVSNKRWKTKQNE